MQIAIPAILFTLVFVLSVLSLVFRRKKSKVAPQPREERAARVVGAGRRGARRRRGVRNNEESSEDEAVEGVEEEENDSDEEVVGSRQQRIKAYEEKRRQRDEERERQEAEEAAEILRKAEDRRKVEEEEAAKWAEFITVEEQGEVEDVNEEALLEHFLATIKSRKIVVLEELAAEFGIRTQEVIQRVEALEQGGRLTGVMDDRGKYLYISRSEMVKVVDFIRSRGRVSIGELASVSHRLVDLECHR